MTRRQKALENDIFADNHSWLENRLTEKGPVPVLSSVGSMFVNLEQFYFPAIATYEKLRSFYEKGNKQGISMIINKAKKEVKALTDVSIYPEPIWLNSKELTKGGAPKTPG